MNGVIVINKPQQFTSFDVVAVMRRLCGQRKIGHTGTLDPMATGVLPILLGNATRAQDILPDSDKEYEAGFMLGKTTDTLDIWGETVSENGSSVLQNDIANVLPEFTGDISQTPPMYSAVKKDGVRLYDLARKGIEVEREPRMVRISELELLSFDEETQTGKLRILCSKGTYVRSLIDDIGQSLGCGAVMTSLVRTKACGFTLEDARSLDEIKDLTNAGAESEKALALLRTTELLFDGYRRITVSEAQAKRFSNGGALSLDKLYAKGLVDGQLVRICGRESGFIGLAKIDTEKTAAVIYKLFPRI